MERVREREDRDEGWHGGEGEGKEMGNIPHGNF